MDVPISEIISQFVVAAIIFYFARQNEIYLKQELERLRREHDELQEKYYADLRELANINPRAYIASRPAFHPESDTQLRRYMLSEEERAKAEKLMNE